jgi:hypothetical protein
MTFSLLRLLIDSDTEGHRRTLWDSICCKSAANLDLHSARPTSALKVRDPDSTALITFTYSQPHRRLLIGLGRSGACWWAFTPRVPSGMTSSPRRPVLELRSPQRRAPAPPKSPHAGSLCLHSVSSVGGLDDPTVAGFNKRFGMKRLRNPRISRRGVTEGLADRLPC